MYTYDVSQPALVFPRGSSTDKLSCCMKCVLRSETEDNDGVRR